MKKFILNLQFSCKKKDNLPTKTQLNYWVKSVFSIFFSNAEVTIRIVNKLEIQKLNLIYRKKNYPTNVLAFPLFYQTDLNHQFFGDLIICKEIIEYESLFFKKKLKAHWAHIVVHGLLHLIGYLHDSKEETLRMESLESKILERIGYSNPYQE